MASAASRTALGLNSDDPSMLKMAGKGTLKYLVPNLFNDGIIYLPIRITINIALSKHKHFRFVIINSHFFSFPTKWG